MEVNVNLRIAIWSIANLAIDMQQDKINGEEFENLAIEELVNS